MQQIELFNRKNKNLRNGLSRLLLKMIGKSRGLKMKSNRKMMRLMS